MNVNELISSEPRLQEWLELARACGLLKLKRHEDHYIDSFGVSIGDLVLWDAFNRYSDNECRFHKTIETVYLPSSGKMYHDFSCKHISVLKSGKTRLGRAIENRLGPCHLCMYWDKNQIIFWGVSELLREHQENERAEVEMAKWRLEHLGLPSEHPPTQSPAPSRPPTLMRMTEASDFLRLSPQKIKIAIKEGALRVVDTPEGIRFRLSDLKQFQRRRLR